jgi:hypothetical protein
MDLHESIETQLRDSMEGLEMACGDLQDHLEDDEHVITEELERRVQKHAAGLIAAVGALRALDEALSGEDDDEPGDAED